MHILSPVQAREPGEFLSGTARRRPGGPSDARPFGPARVFKTHLSTGLLTPRVREGPCVASCVRASVNDSTAETEAAPGLRQRSRDFIALPTESWRHSDEAGLHM